MSRRQSHFWVYFVTPYSLRLAPLRTNPMNSNEFQQTKLWHAILLEARKTVNLRKLFIKNEISVTFLRFYRNSNPTYSFWLFFRFYVGFGPNPLKPKNKRNTPERKKRRGVLFLRIYWSSKEWYECNSFSSPDSRPRHWITIIIYWIYNEDSSFSQSSVLGDHSL